MIPDELQRSRGNPGAVSVGYGMMHDFLQVLG